MAVVCANGCAYFSDEKGEQITGREIRPGKMKGNEMAYAINTGTFGRSLNARIAHAIEEFKAARALRKDYNETLTELRRLGDRELMDLGISRYDIREIAYRHVYGD